jgi:hypothetical protein
MKVMRVFLGLVLDQASEFLPIHRKKSQKLGNYNYIPVYVLQRRVDAEKTFNNILKSVAPLPEQTHINIMS